MYKMLCLVVFGVVGSIPLTSGYGINRYPSNRMLDFNWPEPDERIVRIPHEKYCHYYYKREGHEFFTIRKCPPGEMFDYHTHECKEKHSAQCWSHYYGKHAVHDHIHSKWRKHFKCPFPNGNYPDIFDCEKYIVCLDGKPHHKHCGPNHQFDKNRRHCLYAAVCANSTDAALLTHMCPYSSGKFAHLEDCSKYYSCHKSEPTVKACRQDELFHEDDRECKARKLVDCGDRPNPYRKTSNTELIPESIATDKFPSSFSSENAERNTANTRTVEPNKQSVATNNFLTSDETSVVIGKAVTESVIKSETTENLYSSTSANIGQTVVKSEAISNSYSSISSKNLAKPTEQSVTVDDKSHTSMPSSEAAVKSTAVQLTDDSRSSMPAVESTVQPEATKDSHSSMTLSNRSVKSTEQPGTTNNSHSSMTLVESTVQPGTTDNSHSSMP